MNTYDSMRIEDQTASALLKFWQVSLLSQKVFTARQGTYRF